MRINLFLLSLSILLLIGTLVIIVNVHRVEASATIYIRPDGSIDPPSVNITTLDEIIYTFTGNINDSIVIEKDSIVLDGSGYTMQGKREGYGIDLSNRTNVTVKNVTIVNFNGGVNLYTANNNTIAYNNLTSNLWGIYVWSSNGNILTHNEIHSNDLNGIRLNNSSNNIITNNSLTNNSAVVPNKYYEILLSYSNNNIITHNNVSDNSDGMRIASSSDDNFIADNNIFNNLYGIRLSYAIRNMITNNTVYDNDCGIYFWSSHNNTLVGNDILNNGEGVLLEASRNNVIFHNHFTDNTIQASSSPGYANSWDNGYPSGGNYWDDYTDVDQYSGPYQNETGSDGIWDHPYVIDEFNPDVDNYPIVPEYPSPAVLLVLMITTLLVALVPRKKRPFTSMA